MHFSLLLKAWDFSVLAEIELRSDIAVTPNVYTYVGLEDAENELRKMQTLEGESDKNV